jgi:biopolymer transport protein ExbD
MALGQVLQQRKSFKPPALQITSMMDMFTIIVFFLLFSYSDKPDEFDISSDLELPASSAHIDYKNSIQLYISSADIKVNEETIGTLTNFQVDGLNANNIEASSLFKALSQLNKESTNTVLAELLTDEEPAPKHVLVFCDKAIPFKTLNLIVKTAGMAGFTNFQLAVTEAG